MREKNRRARLDELLVERSLAPSRSRARAEIMAGRVLVEGQVCDKPGALVSREAFIQLREPANPYVSRGGLKLEGALEELGLSVEGLIVLDVGASTGGFTHCLLEKGALHVIALDVGFGQLDWRLRRDPRVTVMERFNVRHLQPQQLPRTPDLATVDVSFISLRLVLPVLKAAGVDRVLALVKPQFEAGRAEASRGRGVIRDPAVHRAVLLELVEFARGQGYYCAGLVPSRWPGPRGNREFFLYLTVRPEAELPSLEEVVSRAVKPGEG
ncbi:MAG TPA: TlyA family RNA methyltransferase [Bacillota bacterium]|nr:TlyA family RNA methyltransferase [Bacillota bacterium]HOB87245.1 TlyA family RNA methyltransferase [Bacillota bacterium]HOP68959.1 TlyA family RNA methyltransferase [Bacillota bacterium]HPT33893.1 TlyA family RNA methyltransferase [Bacillota bacterium]HPZ64574.1 TlyA family RNA methyltransferase [Bacillota bacterium]